MQIETERNPANCTPPDARPRGELAALRVGRDPVEAERLLAAMERVPEFERRLRELSAGVGSVAEKLARLTPLSYDYEIERMLWKTLFAPLENRPFRNPTDADVQRLKASVRHHGAIANRNRACEVCGENRATEVAHVVPVRLGAPAPPADDNALQLCPTHHRLFDQFMLSRAEFAAIDWTRHAMHAVRYVETVVLPGHRAFWEGLESGRSEPMRRIDEDPTPFIRTVVDDVVDILSRGIPVRRDHVYKVLPETVRFIAHRVVDVLVKGGFVVQSPCGSANDLLLATSAIPNDDVARRVRSRL